MEDEVDPSKAGTMDFGIEIGRLQGATRALEDRVDRFETMHALDMQGIRAILMRQDDKLDKLIKTAQISQGEANEREAQRRVREKAQQVRYWAVGILAGMIAAICPEMLRWILRDYGF